MFQPWRITLLSLFALTPILQAQAIEPAKPQAVPHDKPVYAVAFTPDGRTLLAASGDGSVRLWDPAARREVRRWHSHHDGALALGLTADGATLATGGRDGLVRFWNLRTGKETAQVTAGPGDVEGLSLSGDGKVLATSGSGRTGTFRTTGDGQFLG